jgi:hypothetical protein
MSEIFAPGSIAGATGATGPAGPPANFAGAWASGTAYTAGQAVSYTPNGNSYVALTSTTGNEPDTSPTQWGLLAAASVGAGANFKSFSSSLLPSLGQLFDSTRVTTNSGIDSTGALSPGSGWDVSQLIYCPGVISAITNIPIRFGDTNSTAFFALYDAAGNFMGSISSTSVGSALYGGAPIMVHGTAFPMPGTQTYCRFCWTEANQGGEYPLNAAASFYGVTSGTATLPGTYAAYDGIETTADVNAKISASSSASTAIVGTAIDLALNSTLSGAYPRNLFNPLNYVPNVGVNSSGVVVANSGFRLVTIYCPGETSAITNVPIYAYEASQCVCTYDASGNFIADITASWTSGHSTIAAPYLDPNVSLPLPGTQTFVKFSYIPNYTFGVGGWANAPEQSVFYAGNSVSPAPSSLSTVPFRPFADVGTLTVKTAFELGASPSIYNSAAIDCTAVLNAFLATATATNAVKLILDTGMISTTGLVISPYGNTTIEGSGAGSGIQVIGGTPQDGIRIGAYTSSTGYSEGAYNITPPTRTAKNIVLRNFTIDASGQVNAAANQPVSGAIAHATYGLVIANATNVLVDCVNFGGSVNYCLMATNTNYLRVTNSTFITAGTLHDGVHIDGVCEDIGIENCDFATGDDAIALNAPEGYGGDISRVTVTNCRFKGSLSVMRIYTSVTTATYPTNNVHSVRNVVVSNCTGYTNGYCFVLGISDGVNPTSDVDQLVDLTVSNCSLSSISACLATLNTPIGSLKFTGIIFAPANTGALIQGYPSSVGRLEFDGLIIRRTSAANSAPTAIVGLIGGAMGELILRNVSVLDTPGSSYSAMGALVSTAWPVAVLELDSIDMTHITGVVDSNGYSNVTAIRGAGLLATEVTLPDAKMQDGWLYASSDDSGAISLKVAGTAKRLTLT